MENKSVKMSQGTKICIIIISLLVIALVVVYYLGFIKDTEKNTNMVVANNTSTVVPTSELVTLCYETGNKFTFAYIEDGYLYYFSDSNIEYATPSNTQKYEDLSNIKKMETHNIGTSVNPVPFLITEEGQVYRVEFYPDNGIEVKLYEALKDYGVEDIISHSGEMSSTFEILLKDGTTKIVECENDGTPKIEEN